MAARQCSHNGCRNKTTNPSGACFQHEAFGVRSGSKAAVAVPGLTLSVSQSSFAPPEDDEDYAEAPIKLADIVDPDHIQAEAHRALVTLRARAGSKYLGRQNDDEWAHDAWEIKFSRYGKDGIKELSLPYDMGTAHDGDTPDAVQVYAEYMEARTQYEEFEGDSIGWAIEYGYQSESDFDPDFSLEVIEADGVTSATDSDSGASIEVRDNGNGFAWHSVDRNGSNNWGQTSSRENSIAEATQSASYGMPTETISRFNQVKRASDQLSDFERD